MHWLTFRLGSAQADRPGSRYSLALGVSTRFGPNFSTSKNSLVKIGEIVVATFSSDICEADGVGDVRCEVVSPDQIIISYSCLEINIFLNVLNPCLHTPMLPAVTNVSEPALNS